MVQTKLRTEQFQKEASHDLQVALGPLPEITNVTAGADVSGSLSGKYFTISSTSTDFYVWMDVAGVSEITDIATVADVASSLNNKYFTLNSPSVAYYVWYSDGTGVDPVPGGTAIPVVYTAGATADTIASLTQTAITALPAFSASVTTNTVTVTNADAGVATDAADINTTFTITPTTQGVAVSIDPAPGGTGLGVVLSRNASANTVASQIQSVIDGQGSMGASVSVATVTVTNASTGSVVDAVDVDSGFGITITQQGDPGDNFIVGFNFTTPSALSATLLVFVDGIKQVEGATYDYQATAPNVVLFDVGSIPTAGQLVEWYGLG